MGIFPKFRDENSKNIWNHHLEKYVGIFFLSDMTQQVDPGHMLRLAVLDPISAVFWALS